MLCPRCSGELVEDCPTCPACGWVRPHRDPSAEPETPTAHWLRPDETGPVNTSGTDLPPPAEVREMGYCWGGYSLPFEFSWANNIALGCISNGLLTSMWLGRHGHEAAWKGRHFRSFEHFRATMQAWNRWGKIALVARIVLLLLMLAVVAGSSWSFGRHGGDGPPSADEGAGDACLANMRSIALAARSYGYSNEGQLPPAGNWPAALKPWLPGHRWPQCPLKAIYRANPNICGRRYRDLERFVGLVYEADQSGRLAYVHRAAHLEANVACTNGEAFSECSQHPGRIDWAGPPPPGLARKNP